MTGAVLTRLSPKPSHDRQGEAERKKERERGRDEESEDRGRGRERHMETIYRRLQSHTLHEIHNSAT